MIADLIQAILTYESDTFSASGSEVTGHEASVMADKLAREFIDMVKCGGRTYCDGDKLSALLEEVRDSALLEEVRDRANPDKRHA